jgi:SSS family solute:Na+ symporter
LSRHPASEEIVFISTIFTLDFFNKKIITDASEASLIEAGKITVALDLLIAVIIDSVFGIDKKGGFEFIQEYKGFVNLGIFIIFILGFF